MNMRELALRTLREISFKGAYSNIAVKDALFGKNIGKTERDFFSRLVYGTLDKEITLDYIIKRHSKLRLKKLSENVLIILRMGLYQIMFMDAVPDSAAVNESVKLARKFGHGGAAGFVNAVLRSSIRSETQYPAGPVEYLSVRYSYPQQWCERWINSFGYEFTEELMKAFEKPRPLVLRPNTLKVSAEELCAMLNDKGIQSDAADGSVIADGFDIAADELYRSGYYTVQDRAAMQSALKLAPGSGETVIDMCAAPGGKTTHMAELMKNEGRIIAFDIYPHKTELIRKNAKRLGIDIIKASVGDASVYDEAYSEYADRVLCDVPCTGTGIVGRKPDIKRVREFDSDITDTQRKILGNAAAYLKRGGHLLYSTCSLEREENEGVTGGFLSENNGFEKIFEKTYYPHIDDTDGFYVCLMRKK